MHEVIILTIVKYMEENLVETMSGLSKRDICKQSYSRWVIDEILIRLIDNPFSFPDLIIEDFITELVILSHWAKNEKTEDIFFTAKCMAEDILSIVASQDI